MWSLNSAFLLLGLLRFEAAEPHMGTMFQITLYAPDALAAEQATAAAFARIKALDDALSDYKPESELNIVCRTAFGSPARVSKDLFRVLQQAQQVAFQTQGAFDVTLGPVIRVWREARRAGRLPDPAAVQDAQSRSGYRQLRLGNGTVQLLAPNMQLDLGGIAKGYAADEALRVLRTRGIRSALVAAGGDLAIGDPPPGRPGWSIGLDALDRQPRTVTLSSAAVSTSGDTEQFVEIDGRRYSHIVDPRTGIGLTTRRSATVIAKHGITADPLATAACVTGSLKTENAAVLIVEDGRVYQSPNFPATRSGTDDAAPSTPPSHTRPGSAFRPSSHRAVSR